MAAVSKEVAYARLLRPFSTRRLSDALYHVHATAGSIHHRETRLLISPPATPEDWAFELDMIAGDLWALADYCQRAQVRVELLAKRADRDFAVAVDAMRAAMRGLQSEAGERAAG